MLTHSQTQPCFRRTSLTIATKLKKNENNSQVRKGERERERRGGKPNETRLSPTDTVSQLK